MGKYCKAYHVKRFRGFDGWRENLESLRAEKKLENGKEVERPRTALLDEDILYLQENYVVTDGIFKDENIVFGDVTDEWKRFCAEVLEFQVPDFASSGAES
ncbi:MAG: hypothetical protein ACRD21_15590 [Vicinamibacteria bacterium]